MAAIIRFIGKLPVPKSVRLAWQADLIDRSFRKEIAKLRASKDPYYEKLQSLEASHDSQMSMIEEEQSVQYKDQLIRQARRLRAPVPKMFSEDGKPTNLWEQGRTLGLWYLSDSGVSQLRNEIRKELRWRYERRAHYTAWIAGLIGILGTILGFIVGFLTRMASK
ncbi:MAG: hypothetical protein HYS38_07225 [Acidobacteria bacterium]|nr:hypothetical protein [Acidobacteriota bacterium]